MSIFIEKQLLRVNYVKNPRFVLTSGVLTGWTHSSSLLAEVPTGGVSVGYTGVVQTFSFTDPNIPQGPLFWNVEVVASASSSITLERDDGQLQARTFSLVAGENRVLYLNTRGQDVFGQPTFRIKWTGNPGVSLNLVSAYVSADPGTTFAGDDPEFWSQDPSLQRSYDWAGDPYNSFSQEHTGGFWSAEWAEPPAINTRQQNPPDVVEDFADTFTAEISYGLEWVSLNDHLNFKLAADEFGTRAVTLRRKEVSSDFYDGSFLIHTTKENVHEVVSIWVHGGTQNEVTENLLMLEDLFSQPTYQIRIRFGDHRETWICMSADYAIERTHVYMHNGIALFKATVPRKPNMINELVI